jgi:hypothetical protein
VVLPWSMWATMAMFRMLVRSVICGLGDRTGCDICTREPLLSPDPLGSPKERIRGEHQEPDQAQQAERRSQKRIDKAAAKGVIHRNAAARRNSRLAKKLNAASEG